MERRKDINKCITIAAWFAQKDGSSQVACFLGDVCFLMELLKADSLI